MNEKGAWYDVEATPAEDAEAERVADEKALKILEQCEKYGISSRDIAALAIKQLEDPEVEELFVDIKKLVADNLERERRRQDWEEKRK